MCIIDIPIFKAKKTIMISFISLKQVSGITFYDDNFIIGNYHHKNMARKIKILFYSTHSGFYHENDDEKIVCER